MPMCIDWEIVWIMGAISMTYGSVIMAMGSVLAILLVVDGIIQRVGAHQMQRHWCGGW